MVAPVKMSAFSLPPFVIRKILGIGHGGEYDSMRSTARGERMSMPCAPSPPRHFCHEKVTTSSLSHGMSIAKTADVESAMARPLRSAGIGTFEGQRTPEVVPLKVKTTCRARTKHQHKFSKRHFNCMKARRGNGCARSFRAAHVSVPVDLGQVGEHAVVCLHVRNI